MNPSLLPLKDRSIYKVKPFIGHPGVGARISIVYPQINSGPQLPSVILRESIVSQVVLILSLATICIYPAWLVLTRPHLLNGGWIVQAILIGASLLTLPFLLKYMRRLLGLRHIAIDRIRRRMIFRSEARMTDREIMFSDVVKISIAKSNYRSMKGMTWNYTLVLSKKDGEEIELCTSDDESNISKVQNCLQELIK